MTNEQMRQAVHDSYSGADWRNRVKHMSEAQVVAVYMRLKNQGRIK